MSDIICRGSWLLGTACGKCSRCEAEAPVAIEHLQKTITTLTQRVTLVVSCIPSKPPHGYDLVDATKIKLFEACRSQLYDEKGALR